jgi:hypothetical protein
VESLPRIKCLKWLKLPYEEFMFCLQHCPFLSSLHKNDSLQELDGIHEVLMSHSNQELVAVRTARSIFARNGNLVHAKSLLALQPRTGMPIGSKSGLWYMSFWNWTATSHQHDNGGAISGASAIYKVFQARPALLEKQLRRPVDVASDAASATAASSNVTSRIHPQMSMQSGQREARNNNNNDSLEEGNISLALPGRREINVSADRKVL